MATILQTPFFIEIILPFLLVFAVVFAILQKSEVLGKGKKQVDSIVALVVGLVVISFGKAIGIIIGLTTFLAVSIVVILVFMILVGAFFKQGTFEIKGKTQIALGVLAFLAVAIAVLYYTGAWNYLYGTLFYGNSALGTNILFIVLIVIAIGVVVWGGGSGKPSGSEGKGN